MRKRTRLFARGSASLLALLLAATAVAVVPAPGVNAAAPQDAEATCSRPASDADALYIISNLMPRQSEAYWWSKSRLTIGIHTVPNVDRDQYAVVERAVRTWEATIRECLGGAVSLTYVPTTPGSVARTDIVVRLVPHAGGLALSGFARCMPSGCRNVLVSYAAPPGHPGEDNDPDAPLWFTEGIALHEIGHALGLGHATNIFQSTDLMGYGWGTLAFARVPDITQCDVDALAHVWAWALNGTQPTRPTGFAYTC